MSQPHSWTFGKLQELRHPRSPAVNDLRRTRSDTGLLRTNGTGKSTLITILCGSAPSPEPPASAATGPSDAARLIEAAHTKTCCA